jgi:hypothetical protein
MTDQEFKQFDELAFLFAHQVIQAKEYPALAKLAAELQEKVDAEYATA